MLCSFGLASAQNSDGKVTGVILSESNGEPLVGVSILVKGTTQGTVTDLNGAFSLPVKQGETLKISYVGYVTQEVKASGTNLSVKMKESVNNLDELIVIGYGVQKKKLVTGATVSLKGENLEKLKARRKQ